MFRIPTFRITDYTAMWIRCDGLKIETSRTSTSVQHDVLLKSDGNKPVASGVNRRVDNASVPYSCVGFTDDGVCHPRHNSECPLRQYSSQAQLSPMIFRSLKALGTLCFVAEQRTVLF